jgi:lactoylglutathione lyase
MAGKKKSKKEKKAAKKAKKEARKAKKRAAQARPSAPGKSAPAAPRTAKRAPTRAAKRAPSKKATPPAPARRSRPPLTARRQPESLRLRAAGPSFTVNDVQRSLEFYRDVLGFTPKERWEQEGVLHGVEMVAGSVTFWLGQDDWKKGRDRVKGVGFRMYCETSQDVDAIARRIRDAGVTLLEEPKDEPWGGRAFAVTDPDGFAITITSGA